MNKKIYLIVLLSLLSLVLVTGCFDGQVDIKMTGDGSADLSYAMVIDKRSYDPELLELFIEKLEENLFTVEMRDMDEIIIVNASVYLPRFRTVFDPTTVFGNEEGRIPLDFKRGWFYSRYKINIDYDLQKTLNFLEKELNLEDLDFNSMAFSIRLPNKPVKTNAHEVRDNERTHVWTINKQGNTLVDLETKTANTINFIVAIGVPVLAIFALINNKDKENQK